VSEELNMKCYFSLDLFLDWNRFQGARERAIEKMMKECSWKSYEGMEFEEVKKREPYVLREWFKTEVNK
jgi:hypothetical protein